ncbi:hypothetical protein B0I37DRAFT_46163 [Chaetomium sp. MPI-CAGE-AT-0009]|nr:hypothetical protein B0I37DRAFT_46163 [Chaetomium sp. MPI-CAGE-AT-0009]
MSNLLATAVVDLAVAAVNKGCKTSHRLRPPGHWTGNVWGHRGAVSCAKQTPSHIGKPRGGAQPGGLGFRDAGGGRSLGSVGAERESVADERDTAERASNPHRARDRCRQAPPAFLKHATSSRPLTGSSRKCQNCSGPPSTRVSWHHMRTAPHAAPASQPQSHTRTRRRAFHTVHTVPMRPLFHTRCLAESRCAPQFA